MKNDFGAVLWLPNWNRRKNEMAGGGRPGVPPLLPYGWHYSPYGWHYSPYGWYVF